MRKPIAVLAAVASLAAAASAVPTASAAEKSADFRVTVEGTQTNKWSSSYKSQGKCDASGEADGTETVRFATRRAQRVTVNGDPFVHFGAKYLPLTLPTRAKITRYGAENYQPTPPECGGTGGGSGKPPKPDCGTKRVPWKLQAHYWFNDDQISLEHQGGVYDDPFTNCPVAGVGFPQLLTSDSSYRYIRGKVKPGRFFDKRVDTIVVHAAGKRVEKKPALGIDRTATVDWKLTFHRIDD